MENSICGISDAKCLLFGQPLSCLLEFVRRKKLHRRTTDSRSCKSKRERLPTSLSDDGDLGNFMPVQDIKIEIIPIRAALPAFKVLKNHEQARVRSALDMTGECAFLALNSDRFKMPVMRSTQMPSAWNWI